MSWRFNYRSNSVYTSPFYLGFGFCLGAEKLHKI